MINQTVWNMSGTVYQNYKKHSHCIRQSAIPVNSTVQQYVQVNTKGTHPYLSAIPSVSSSYYTLRSHTKHTVCLCVSCEYIWRKVTHYWNITFMFHCTLYVLCQAVTKIKIKSSEIGQRVGFSTRDIKKLERMYKNVWKTGHTNNCSKLSIQNTQCIYNLTVWIKSTLNISHAKINNMRLSVTSLDPLS